MSMINQFKNGIKKTIKEEKLIVGISVSFILTLIFTFTPIWQLSILAALLGGLFYAKMGKGALASLTGVGAAWLLVIIIELLATDVNLLLNQISGIIIGSTSLGWIFIVLVILLGTIFGALGGSLGSGIRAIVVQGKSVE